MRDRPGLVLLLAFAASPLGGCGASTTSATRTDGAESVASSPANPRYHATVPTPNAPDAHVERAALRRAQKFVEQQLAQTGGSVDGDDGQQLPAYVFRGAVQTMESDPSGRTRAEVEIVVRVRKTGKIVGMLRGAATAYTDRNAPLAERQQRALRGAFQGALQPLPQLLERLEDKRAVASRP
jgi:hypothetical protein